MHEESKNVEEAVVLCSVNLLLHSVKCSSGNINRQQLHQLAHRTQWQQEGRLGVRRAGSETGFGRQKRREQERGETLGATSRPECTPSHFTGWQQPACPARPKLRFPSKLWLNPEDRSSRGELCFVWSKPEPSDCQTADFFRTSRT